MGYCEVNLLDDSAPRGAESDPWERLVRELGGSMYTLACRLCVDRAAAAAAVQDAFAETHRVLDVLNGNDAIRAWLRRATLNACILRANLTRSTTSSNEHAFDDDGAWTTPPAAWRADAASFLASPEGQRLIERRLGQLPVDRRLVLVLADVEGMPCQAAANLLEITTSDFRRRLNAARAALRRLLDPDLRPSLQ